MKQAHYNTRAEVKGYLEDALEIVAELEPPEDLRVAAFAKAAELIANKQVVIERDDLEGPIAVPLSPLLGGKPV